MNQLQKAWEIYESHLRTCPYNSAAAVHLQCETKHKLIDVLGRDCIGQAAILRGRFREAGIPADVYQSKWGHANTVATIDDRQYIFDSSITHLAPVSLALLHRESRTHYFMPLYGGSIHQSFFEVGIDHDRFPSYSERQHIFFTKIHHPHSFSTQNSINLSHTNNDSTPDAFLSPEKWNFKQFLCKFLDPNHVILWSIITDIQSRVITLPYYSQNTRVKTTEDHSSFSSLLEAISMRLGVEPDGIMDYFKTAASLYQEIVP